MKIAIVTQFPKDPLSPYGGVEAVSLQLIKHLAKFTDLRIDVITLDNAISEVQTQAWQGATVHRLPIKDSFTLINAIGSGRKIVQSYIKKLSPDLIHAHDTYGLMVQKIEKVPRIFTIHGFIYGDTLVSKQKFAWLRSKIWKYFETRSWADHDCIISISPYVREKLAGTETGRIYDIDNPIDESFFSLERNERKGIIFSAAVISPRKNTLKLIESFYKIYKKYEFTELRLAGPIVNEEYGKMIKKYIAERNLENGVKLLGRIDQNEIKKELSMASVFTLVSLEENAPMGIEEAMAAGLPIVTSNRCGMPYMVRHQENGYLIDPNDSDEIAIRISSLIHSDDVRNAFGKKSKEIATTRFYPSKIAAQTRNLYYDILRLHLPKEYEA